MSEVRNIKSRHLARRSLLLQLRTSTWFAPVTVHTPRSISRVRAVYSI